MENYIYVINFEKITSTPRFEQGPMTEWQSIQSSNGSRNEKYRM
jgi:hypothetical protein